MLKKTTSFSLLILIVSSMMFYSCIDEPFIEPVKTPYSMIRVGNFTNVASIDVEIQTDIDDSTVVVNRTIAQNTFTEYFSVTSGNRVFTVTMGDDTLFTNPISVISYNQTNFMFAGNYLDSENNSVGFRSYSLGKVYLEDFVPSIDTSLAYFVNLVSSDTVASEVLFIVSTTDTVETIPDSTQALATYDDEGFRFEQGPHQFLVESAVMADTIVQDISSGKVYYIIAAGAPDNVQVYFDSNDPLPPQEK